MSLLSSSPSQPRFPSLRRIQEQQGGFPIVADGFMTELMPDLLSIVLDASGRDATFPSLNLGGWKSSDDFFQWRFSAVQLLRQGLSDVLDGHDPSGWAMVNRAGSHHPRHRHQTSAISGVVYVDPGEEESSPTVFEVDDGRIVHVVPAPGRLVIFPGGMWHSVPRYDGEAPRVTIAFDVR